MAGKREPDIAYIVSLCGIMCGLAIVLMFMLSMIPSFEYISPACAGILIWVIRERLGVKYGLVSYIAVGILCVFFTPRMEAALMYVFLLGYYPIIRQYLEKIKLFPLRWLTKLSIYAASSISCYCMLIYILGQKELLEDMGDFGKYGAWVLLGFGAVAFVAYDVFLGLFFPFYEKLLKPKIQKRMR